MSNQPTNTKLQAVLEQEVTRMQFIQLVGVGIASVLGFGNLLNLLHRFDRNNGPAGRDGKSGFGGGKFGV